MNIDERLHQLEAQFDSTFEPVSFWSFNQNWPAYLVILFLLICGVAALIGMSA
jgi:hypothetical protein